MQTRRSTSNLTPKATNDIPKEIIIATNNMSDTDDTTTPTKKDILDNKSSIDLLPKIPKVATKTAPPHYVNKEEKKLYKWP